MSLQTKDIFYWLDRIMEVKYEGDKLYFVQGHARVEANKLKSEITKLKAQRDELVKSLEELTNGLHKTVWSSWQTTSHFWDKLEKADELLLKAKETP